MNKSYCLLVIMLATIFSYGQEITFEKNISYAARQLKLVQNLNKNGDSLILESGSEKIRQVDILNNDYLESVVIDSTKAKINLKKLSLGNYVIQARIGTYWIVMYLEKKEDNNAELKNNDKFIKIATTSNSLNDIILNENNMYWIVYETNSQFASCKTMALKYVDEIQDLIYKIELELKTEPGKNNKLSVYEIYNKPEFMLKQLRNKKYYEKKMSKLFNVLPLYDSEDVNVNKS